MKILLAGGTGFIGRALIKNLSAEHSIVLLTRRNIRIPQVRVIAWDGQRTAQPVPEADAVINLCGENIAQGTWTKRRKRQLEESRTKSVEALAKMAASWQNPPQVWLNASATGFYGDSGGAVIDEDTSAGNDFLARTAVAWESAVQKEVPNNVRKVYLRFGVVLGRGGILARLKLPFLLGCGAVMGSGDQFFPWIHEQDAVNAIQFLLMHKEARGPWNIVAPEIVTARRWTKAVGKALHRPIWLRIPEFILKVTLGEMSTLFLNSQKVSAKKLIGAGFSWRYPQLDSAVAEAFSTK